MRNRRLTQQLAAIERRLGPPVDAAEALELQAEPAVFDRIQAAPELAEIAERLAIAWVANPHASDGELVALLSRDSGDQERVQALLERIQNIWCEELERAKKRAEKGHPGNETKP